MEVIVDTTKGVYKERIVRCKECKWYKDFDGCFFSTAEVDANGFCSYGERE